MMQKSHIEGAVNLTIDLVVGLILQRVEAMNRKSNQILRPTTAAIMLLCVYAASALGQQEEMQISNTVQQLLTQMADSDIAGRDTAEANRPCPVANTASTSINRSTAPTTTAAGGPR